MKFCIILSLTLITGFLGISTFDTMNRLKKIEKKQEAILSKISTNDKIRDEDFLKIWKAIDDVSIETQQCRRISESSLSKLQNLPAPAFSDTLLLSELAAIKKQQENIANFLKLQIIKPDRSAKTSPPPPAPSPSINLGESYEQRIREQQNGDSVRALEGIRDELQQRRINELTK